MSRVRKSTTLWIATLAVVLAGPGVALASPTSSGSAHDAQAAEARFLKEAITQTPYSALVVYTRVDIKPIAGKNGRANAGAPQSADVTEERHIYHARVIETFRGKPISQLRYDMVVEPGETASIDSTPRILTLCSGPQGFYWPGTGAVFTASKDAVVLARQAAKETVSSATRTTRLFAQCN